MTKRAALAFLLCTSGLSHAALPVVPRLVALDTSGSDTPDFALPAGPIESAVTQLRLRFDAPMALPAADALRLLAAGGDGVFSTAGCDAPLGDDLAVAVSSVAAFAQNEIVLQLAAPAGLPRGSYRLALCAGWSSLAGIALDGDGDGLPGGVALRGFSIARDSLLANPGFDAGIAGWTGVQMSADPRDADAAPASGAAQLSGLLAGAMASATCVQVPPASGAWRLRFRYRSLQQTARLFPRAWIGFSGDQGEPGCVGPGVGREFLVVAQPSSEFASFDSGWQSAPGMPLAEVSILAVPAFGSTALDVLIDDVQLQFDSDIIFRDAFEHRGNP